MKQYDEIHENKEIKRAGRNKKTKYNNIERIKKQQKRKENDTERTKE